MRNASAVSTLLLGLSLFAFVHSPASAKEEPVPLDRLPKAVLDAIKAKFPHAKLTGAEMETEDGKTTYEVTLEYKERDYSVAATADGKITEIEREIEIENLPKPVSDAIKKKYPAARMIKAEEVTANDKTTYEVVVEAVGDKHVEITVDANGKIVDEEDEDEEEEGNR